jgi:hypothetical protein
LVDSVETVSLYLVGIKSVSYKIFITGTLVSIFITILQKKECSVHIFDNSKHVQVHVR